MISLGTLSPFEDIQALIKGKVGQFLSAETSIRQMMQNASASIRSQAAALLGEHQALEGELGDAQTKITAFQSGSWSISDVISLGDVGTRLIQHLGKVTSLQNQAGGVMPSGFSIPSGVLPALGIAAVVGAVLLFTRR